MVAIIKTSNSIRRSFYYNESKVKQGLAQCIGAGHYPCNPEELSEKQRLNMLLKLAALNENVQRNSVHISLNFHPDDVLSQKRLCQIAQYYMDRIGFEGQPFLIYQHQDTAHPHLHLVSVVVRADGSRIATNNNARELSELARTHIERQYGLVAAQPAIAHQRTPALSARRVLYGKVATKGSISQVLDVVVPHYKYSSLQELNAILKQYNVVAEPEARQGGLGLLYRITDEHGRRMGVPIKASDLDSKPTLKNLSERFAQNQIAKSQGIPRMRSTLDLELHKTKSSDTIASLARALEKEGINMVIGQDRHGQITEICYVDFRTKCVFGPRDLAPQHSAQAIIEKYSQQKARLHAPFFGQQPELQGERPSGERSLPASTRWGLTAHKQAGTEETSELFDPVKLSDYMPWQLRRSRKKKQKKIVHQL